MHAHTLTITLTCRGSSSPSTILAAGYTTPGHIAAATTPPPPCAHACMHVCAHARAYTHAHTRTHARTHALTHARTHAQYLALAHARPHPAGAREQAHEHQRETHPHDGAASDTDPAGGAARAPSGISMRCTHESSKNVSTTTFQSWLSHVTRRHPSSLRRAQSEKGLTGCDPTSSCTTSMRRRVRCRPPAARTDDWRGAGKGGGGEGEVFPPLLSPPLSSLLFHTNWDHELDHELRRRGFYHERHSKRKRLVSTGEVQRNTAPGTAWSAGGRAWEPAADGRR